MFPGKILIWIELHPRDPHPLLEDAVEDLAADHENCVGNAQRAVEARVDQHASQGHHAHQAVGEDEQAVVAPGLHLAVVNQHSDNIEQRGDEAA